MIPNDFFKKLTDSHPFITVCSYAMQDYVGIVQNRDDVVTTIFKPYLRTFNNKSLVIMHGPTCSMTELHKRRSKRRSITLVKRIP